LQLCEQIAGDTGCTVRREAHVTLARCLWRHAFSSTNC
jgi:hypothetical protein